MRGQFSDQGRMFSYLSPEERVPKGHPLRAVRAMVRTVLEELHGDFARLYSGAGRPSIPPEQLLSALLLQVFYGIRSERQLMEQLDYNLLYRCPSTGSGLSISVPSTEKCSSDNSGFTLGWFSKTLMKRWKMSPC